MILEHFWDPKLHWSLAFEGAHTLAWVGTLLLPCVWLVNLPDLTQPSWRIEVNGPSIVLTEKCLVYLMDCLSVIVYLYSTVNVQKTVVRINNPRDKIRFQTNLGIDNKEWIYEMTVDDIEMRQIENNCHIWNVSFGWISKWDVLFTRWILFPSGCSNALLEPVINLGEYTREIRAWVGNSSQSHHRSLRWRHWCWTPACRRRH